MGKILSCILIAITLLNQTVSASDIKWDPATTPHIPNDGNTYFLSTDATIPISQTISINGILEIRAKIIFTFEHGNSNEVCNYTFYNTGAISIGNNHSLKIQANHGGKGYDNAGKNGYNGAGAEFYNNGTISLGKGSTMKLIAGDSGSGGSGGLIFNSGGIGGNGGSCEFYNKGTLILKEKSIIKINQGKTGIIGQGSMWCNIGGGETGTVGKALLSNSGTIIIEDYATIELNGSTFVAEKLDKIEASDNALLKLDGKTVTFSWLIDQLKTDDSNPLLKGLRL